MIQILHDYFIVELEQLWEVKKTKSKIITLNDAHIQNRADDDDWERNKFKRIYGTVISCPRGYSDQKINPIETGSPQPRIYIGHDMIQERINEGFKDFADGKYYHPGLLESYKFTTTEGFGMLVDVKVGERVFIDPMELEPENLVGAVDGHPHFKIRVDSILGAGSPIRGQGGWTWIRPIKETWEEITSKAGIIMKPAPGYKNLVGTLLSGEQVYFQTNSEWPFQIDGEEMYCTEEENILCVVE